jgi:hypothetical protein
MKRILGAIKTRSLGATSWKLQQFSRLKKKLPPSSAMTIKRFLWDLATKSDHLQIRRHLELWPQRGQTQALAIRQRPLLGRIDQENLKQAPMPQHLDQKQ